MKIVKHIIFILFGLQYIIAGSDKMVHYLPGPTVTSVAGPKVDRAFTTLYWLLPLTGIAELIGGILILFPKTRALGTIVIFPVTAGIIVHDYTLSPHGALLASVLMAINIWMIVDNCKKYRPIIS